MTLWILVNMISVLGAGVIRMLYILNQDSRVSGRFLFLYLSFKPQLHIYKLAQNK